jgi:hypothetical protein
MTAALLCAAALAGCASSSGVAFDLTVTPHCVNDGDLVTRVVVTVQVTPAAQLADGGDQIVFDRGFFDVAGRSNRFVLVVPPATRHVDVSVQAFAGDQLAGTGERGFAVSGPSLTDATIDLGNAACPAAPVDSGAAPPPDLGDTADLSSADAPPPSDAGADGGAPDGGPAIYPTVKGASTFANNALALTLPNLGARPGDVMLAVIWTTGDANSLIAPPMGWVGRGRATNTSPQFTGFFYSHVPEGPEPGGYTFTFDAMMTYAKGAVAVFSGSHAIDNAKYLNVVGGPPYNLDQQFNVLQANALAVVLIAHYEQSDLTLSWFQGATMPVENANTAVIFARQYPSMGLSSFGSVNSTSGSGFVVSNVILLYP